MESKFLLALILAAFLPCPSQQALTPGKCVHQGYNIDDILLMSEESENAAFATLNVNYGEIDAQIQQFFSDVATASQAIRIREVFFANGYNGPPPGLSWRSPFWVSPTVPRDTTRANNPGANLLNGLLAIQGTAEIQNHNKPIKLAIIYASPISRDDVNSIVNTINTIEQNNVKVYLFAVGDATLNINLAASLPGRVFAINSNTDIAGLGQLLTDVVLTCNTDIITSTTTPLQTDEARCDECLRTDGSRLINHLTRCDKFIHCYNSGFGPRAAVKQCRSGTLFDLSLHVCAKASDVLNKNSSLTACNWCNNLQNGATQQNHPFLDSCAAYLECGRNKEGKTILNRKCCGVSQSFNEATGTCVNDASCNRNLMYPHAYRCRSFYQCDETSTTLLENCCPGGNSFSAINQSCIPDVDCAGDCTESLRPKCLSEAVDDCTFRPNSTANTVYEAIRCAPGTYFNRAQCRCASDNEALVAQCKDSLAARTNPICDPDVLVDFGINQTRSDGFEERSNNRRYIDIMPMNHTASFNSGAMQLDGTEEYVIIMYYGNNDLAFQSEIVKFRLQVKDDQSAGPIARTMTVLSNRPCQGSTSPAGSEASILITHNPSTRTFYFMVRVKRPEANSTIQRKDVTLTYPPEYDNNWKEPTLRYNNETGLLEANLRIFDRQNNNNLFETDGTSTVNGVGSILKSDCGLKIGKGRGIAGGVNDFYQGEIDELKFYDDCPKDKSAPGLKVF